MDFTKTYTLADERILLRPLTEDDVDLLIPYALNEPNTWKYSATALVGEQKRLNKRGSGIAGTSLIIIY